MPTGQRRADIIANQVFVGCPYKTIRAKYERAIDELNKKFPLSFVIVGRGDGREAEDLLELIKERLFSSSQAIFDATAGNANVSLEFGLAETDDMPRTLYLIRARWNQCRGGGHPPTLCQFNGLFGTMNLSVLSSKFRMGRL
jgi:hypothetical protein